MFRVISPQSYHSESQSLAFIFTGIAHLTFIILHPSSLTSPCYPVLIAYSSLLVQILVPLHMTQSLEFTKHTSIVLLGTLHLSFSCSSDRVVSFGRRLFRALGRFDRHSSLICFFQSLLETSQREPESSVWLQDILRHHFLLGLEPFVHLLA